MSTAPVQDEDRRHRRRFVLLWFGGSLAVLGLVVAGLVVIGRDGSTRGLRATTGTEALDADGTGTAPVYDRLPAEVDPDPTATPGASTTPLTQAAPRHLDGDQSAGDASQPSPRPHGLGLRLTSTVDGLLQPGVTRTLRVTVRNPNSFTVQLFRVDVRVLAPTAAGCLPSWVQVGRYRYAGGSGSKIEGSTTTTVDLPIKLVDLPNVNQDACRGTAFPLRLSGIAVDDA